MNPEVFESRMRELEWFHNLRVLPGVWTVIRVDGRGFSKLTENSFEKPFDSGFHDCMTKTAQALLLGLQAVYAYTESDENLNTVAAGYRLR
jgi:tRNA(His) 5'-end guanylyltransferase